MHGGGLIGLDAAASYLGLSDEELRTELEDGSTLAEVAGEQDKSVDGLVTALVDSAKAGSRRRGRGRTAHRGAAGRDPRRARGAHHDARERGLPGRARTRRIPGRARRASSDGGRRLGLRFGRHERHERLDEHVRLRCVAACRKRGPSLRFGRRAVALRARRVENSAHNRRASATDHARTSPGTVEDGWRVVHPPQGGARASNQSARRRKDERLREPQRRARQRIRVRLGERRVRERVLDRAEALAEARARNRAPENRST